MQFVTPMLENKVFNIRSSRVARLAAYGVSTTGFNWPPTVKDHTKKEIQMCQSIVSKGKRRQNLAKERRSKSTVGAVFKEQQPLGQKGGLECLYRRGESGDVI